MPELHILQLLIYHVIEQKCIILHKIAIFIEFCCMIQKNSYMRARLLLSSVNILQFSFSRRELLFVYLILP